MTEGTKHSTATRMDLEGFVLMKSDRERQIPHSITYMWNLNKLVNITKKKQIQIQRTNLWVLLGRGGWST